jgi:hypothetical protein
VSVRLEYSVLLDGTERYSASIEVAKRESIAGFGSGVAEAIIELAYLLQEIGDGDAESLAVYDSLAVEKVSAGGRQTVPGLMTFTVLEKD